MENLDYGRGGNGWADSRLVGHALGVCICLVSSRESTGKVSFIVL